MNFKYLINYILNLYLLISSCRPALHR